MVDSCKKKIDRGSEFVSSRKSWWFLTKEKRQTSNALPEKFRTFRVLGERLGVSALRHKHGRRPNSLPEVIEVTGAVCGRLRRPVAFLPSSKGQRLGRGPHSFTDELSPDHFTNEIPDVQCPCYGSRRHLGPFSGLPRDK